MFKRVDWSTLIYFGFCFRLRLIEVQLQRRDSGALRFGVTYTQESQESQRNRPRSYLNAATTGSKSFFSKLAHTL